MAIGREDLADWIQLLELADYFFAPVKSLKEIEKKPHFPKLYGYKQQLHDNAETELAREQIIKIIK